MADLNELFAQGTEEADGFAAEGARAHQSVEQIVRLSAALGDAVEAGAAEARRRLELLSARLLEAEQDLVHENGAALGALASLRAASAEVQGKVGRYLTMTHAQLADLRSEKDRLHEELLQQGESAHAHVIRYSEHVKDVETASRTRMDVARQAVASFRGVVEASRNAVHERREVLLATLQQIQLGARQRVEYVIRAYDAVAAGIQDQVGELQLTLKTLTDQTVAGLTRRLSHDALVALGDAAEPLRDAISDLQDFCKKSRSACGGRIQEIAGQIEDVTSTLEQLRHPLDHIRQHLH